MYRYFLILFLFFSSICYGVTLHTSECSIDVTFNDEGSVRFENIDGNCTVSFYSGTTVWGHHRYVNGKAYGDTFKCCFCPTDKVCLDDVCVSK